MNITVEQAQKRFRSIAPALQDAIFSVQTAEIISNAAGQNNIPAEKIKGIARGVGNVLLGFIHPEDLAKEIAETTGIATQAAEAVSKDINTRIFQTLETELKITYAPVPHEDGDDDGPRIFEEIRPPQQTTTPIPKPQAPPQPPKPVSNNPMSTPPLAQRPIAQTSTTATPQQVNSTFQPGWSSGKTGQARPQLPAQPAPKQTSIPVPPTWNSSAPKEVPISFSQMSVPKNVPAPVQEKRPMAPQVPPTAQTSSEPLPAIIHEEPKSMTTRPTNFNFNPATPNFSDVSPSQKAVPPKPAVLEFASKDTESARAYTPSPASRATPPAPSAPKVVHYTEADTKPVPPITSQPTTPRPQTMPTPSIPVPPPPPAPPKQNIGF